MAVKDELDLIVAMYKAEELLFEEASDGCDRFVVNLLDENKRPVAFSCSISEHYPNEPPMIQVYQPQLDKKKLLTFKTDLLSYLKLNFLIGQPMLLNVISWVKDHVYDFCKLEKLNDNIAQDSNVLCIIQLDHIRSQSRYIKHLKQFSEELDVVCHLIFVERFIFIFLYGNGLSIKKYVTLLKTQKVDVDSCGQPCKEKMSSVLARLEFSTTQTSNSNFFISTQLNAEELNQYLQSIGYHRFYESHILPVIMMKK